MALSVPQCRAARALLDWSAADLAREAGLGIATVKRFESGQVVNAASIDKMAATLDAAGIELISEGGVSAGLGEGARRRASDPTS